MKIYHYTSIDSLALILKNRTLRFTRLDHVDDLEEAKVEMLKPDFYPIAITEVPSPRPCVKHNLENKISGYLTHEEFVRVYDKCGKMLHLYNPFGYHYDYDYYEKKIMGELNHRALE